MMMTMRRLQAFVDRAFSPTGTERDFERLGAASALRRQERGPSKLSRRLRRKHGLGRAGAF